MVSKANLSFYTAIIRKWHISKARFNSSSSTAGAKKSSLQDMFTMGDEQEEGQMFDELMQQLGRIESQYEGKQNLNMLMEFMMSEEMLDGSDDG